MSSTIPPSPPGGNASGGNVPPNVNTAPSSAGYSRGGAAGPMGFVNTIRQAFGALSKAVTGLTVSIMGAQRAASLFARLHGGGGGGGGVANTGSGNPAFSASAMFGGMGGGGMGGMGTTAAVAAVGGAAAFSYKKAMDIVADTSVAPADSMRIMQQRKDFSVSTGTDYSLNSMEANERMAREGFKMGASSPNAYNEIISGLSSMGYYGNQMQGVALTQGLASQWLLGGATASQAVQMQEQLTAPEMQNQLLATMGVRTTTQEGDARNINAINNDILSRLFMGKDPGSTFENEQEMIQALNVSLDTMQISEEQKTSIKNMALSRYKQNDWNFGTGEGGYTSDAEGQRLGIETIETLGLDKTEENPRALQGLQSAAEGGKAQAGAANEYGGMEQAAGAVNAYYDALAKVNQEFGALGNIQGALSMLQSTNGGITGLIPGIIGGNVAGLLGPLIPGSSEGDYNVSADQPRNIHQGEMIIPARIAESIRRDLAKGGRPPENTPHSVRKEARIDTAGYHSTRPAEEALRIAPGSDLGAAMAPAVQPPSDIAPTAAAPPATKSTAAAANVTINVNVASASEAEAVRLAEMIKGHLNSEATLASIAAQRNV